MSARSRFPRHYGRQAYRGRSRQARIPLHSEYAARLHIIQIKIAWGRRNSDGYGLHGHVRFGSLADIGTVSGHVRVTPQKRTSVCALHCAFQLIGNGNKLISYGRVVTRSTACSL